MNLWSGPAAAGHALGGPPTSLAGHSDAELLALGAELDAVYPTRDAQAAHNAEITRRFGPDLRNLSDKQMREVWAIRAAFRVDDVADAGAPVWQLGDDVFAKMLSLPVHTIEGAAVLARATVMMGGISDYWNVPERDLDWDKTTVRNLIERVCTDGRASVPEVVTAELAAAPPPADAELLAMAPEFEALYERWIDDTVAQFIRRDKFQAEVKRRTGVAFDDAPCPIPHDAEERARHPYWGVFDQVHSEMHPNDKRVVDFDQQTAGRHRSRPAQCDATRPGCVSCRLLPSWRPILECLEDPMKPKKTATELAQMIASRVGVDVWSVEVEADGAGGWTAAYKPDIPFAVDQKPVDIGPIADQLRAAYDLAS